MDNTGPDHDWREHACLRVQWVLTGRHGLRAVFAPTTDFRTTFWDTLSGDVLADRTDPSVQLANRCAAPRDKPPWGPHLGPRSRRASKSRAPSLHSPSATRRRAVERRAPAPQAIRRAFLSAMRALACGTCAWRYEHRGKVRCAKPTRSMRTGDRWTRGPMQRFEAAPRLSRRAVRVLSRGLSLRRSAEARSAVKAQPDYIVDSRHDLEIRRNGDRCAALHFGEMVEGKQSPFTASSTTTARARCRDFTLASEHCLTARRRVGMVVMSDRQT